MENKKLFSLKIAPLFITNTRFHAELFEHRSIDLKCRFVWSDVEEGGSRSAGNGDV